MAILTIQIGIDASLGKTDADGEPQSRGVCTMSRNITRKTPFWNVSANRRSTSETIARDESHWYLFGMSGDFDAIPYETRVEMLVEWAQEQEDEGGQL